MHLTLLSETLILASSVRTSVFGYRRRFVVFPFASFFLIGKSCSNPTCHSMEANLPVYNIHIIQRMPTEIIHVVNFDNYNTERVSRCERSKTKDSERVNSHPLFSQAEGLSFVCALESFTDDPTEPCVVCRNGASVW